MKRVFHDKPGRNVFLKNFLAFFAPALLSLLIIGFFSYFLTYRDVKSYVEENNQRILDKVISELESSFNEFEYINLNLSSNSSVKYRLKKVLSRKPFIIASEDYTILRTILDMIFMSASFNNTVHSIYIYFNEAGDLYLSSTDKQIYPLSMTSDISWYDSYRKHMDEKITIWAEIRQLQIGDSTSGRFGARHGQLLTVYRKMYTNLSGEMQVDGVVACNIYTDLIDDILNSLLISDEHILLVVDQNGQKLFSSSNTDTEFETMSENRIEHYIASKREDYVVTQKKFSDFGWQCISLVPHSALYRALYQIGTNMLIGISFSFFISVLLALQSSKNTYRRYCCFMEIINSADTKNMPPPYALYAHGNEYDYIIQNVLRTFIEHDYMQAQISKEKYKQQIMSLQIMQAQMNPHFLLNTLDTIYWRAIRLAGQPNDVASLVQNISEILQYSLYQPMEMVCLMEELDITKSYVEIQRIRHDNQFTVDWQVDFDLLDYRVDKLILQPLMENAISYGRKDNGDILHIRVKANRKGNDMRITIIDNGRGIGREHLAEIRRQLYGEYIDSPMHIGLYNTHKRIAVKYGEPYGLKISSKSALGTVVGITLPLTES